MHAVKMRLTMRLKGAGALEELERAQYGKELDRVFGLDLVENEEPIQIRGDSDDEMEKIEDGFESSRKNDLEEDARIAKTIMEGVAEYTTFEVKLESKEEKMNRASEQFSLDKDLLRLCIMRCFHPDKLMQEIRSFIGHFLGKHFVEIPILNFSKLYKRTSKRTIVLFMCGPNVNCLQELQ